MQMSSGGSTRLLASHLMVADVPLGKVTYGRGSTSATSPAHLMSASPNTPSGRV